MTTRALATILAAGLVLFSAACGDDTSKTSVAPASAAASASAAPTPESTTAAVPGLPGGLIFSICEAQGAPTNQIAAYDPTGQDGSFPHGVRFANALEFGVDSSNGGCNNNAFGRHAKTAFNYDGADGNQPLTRFYASKRQSDGSYQVGYYVAAEAGTDTESSEFTPLTQTGPKGDGQNKEILKDAYPSYLNGRVYFLRITRVDNRDEYALWSVPANGGEAETVAGDDVKGRDFKRGLNNGMAEEVLFMPETAKPVASSNLEGAVFNTAGTLAAVVDDQEMIIGPATDLGSRANDPGTPMESPSFARGHDIVPVGFVSGSNTKVVVTDTVNIFEVDGHKVTRLYKNKSGKPITEVTLSTDGDLAWLMQTDDTTVTAYYLPKGETDPKVVTTFSASMTVGILRLSRLS